MSYPVRINSEMNMTFQAPVNAMQFLLRHGVDMDQIIAQPKFSDTNEELIGDVLNGAAVFARDVVAPTNWDGDQTLALGLCPMLTSSPTKAIEAHASEALKEMYIPKMVSGEWTGAMCLTEPQAGSDLGPVRTKAVDNGDGTYSITGQKIYITWGDHDCADNIVHLVLARLPDSPDGSRGISLFLCPKGLSLHVHHDE